MTDEKNAGTGERRGMVQRYLQRGSNIFVENRLLKFAIAIFAFSSIVSSYLVNNAVNHATVVLVPPGAQSKMTISGDMADDEYLKHMASYVLSLALTYNPLVARGQFVELVSFYHPSSYNNEKNNYMDMAEVIEKSDVSSVFYPQTIQIPVGASHIEAKGQRRQWAKGVEIENDQIAYNIHFRIDNGRFWLLKIEEIREGTEVENNEED